MTPEEAAKRVRQWSYGDIVQKRDEAEFAAIGDVIESQAAKIKELEGRLEAIAARADSVAAKADRVITQAGRMLLENAPESGQPS